MSSLAWAAIAARSYALVKPLWELASWRWCGPSDGLPLAWRLTFAEGKMPKPVHSITYGQGNHKRWVYFYRGVRLVVRWADGTCEIRAVDMESMGRMMGTRLVRLVDGVAKMFGIDLAPEDSRPDWFHPSQYTGPQGDDGRAHEANYHL